MSWCLYSVQSGWPYLPVSSVEDPEMILDQTVLEMQGVGGRYLTVCS